MKAGLLLLMLAALFCSCRRNDLKEVATLTGNMHAGEISTGVRLIYSDSAKVRAVMNAPEMDRFTENSPRLILPKGLNIKFYDTALHITSTLKANYGIRYLDKGLTDLKGSVHVVNIKGDTLDTEELFWNEKNNKVYSNKFVKVKTKSEVILADGFESDITFSKYTFYKIKGIISLKK